MEFEEYKKGNYENCQFFDFLKYSPLFLLLVLFLNYFYFPFASSSNKFQILTFTGNHTKNAFVTYTEDTVEGAYTLGYQLEQFHGQKYDRICLVPKSIGMMRIKLLQDYWKVIITPHPIFKQDNYALLRKIRAWTLVDYEKIIYISDFLLPLKPFDNIFNMPELSCVPQYIVPNLCDTNLMVLEPEPRKFEQIFQNRKNIALAAEIGDSWLINGFFKTFHPLHPRYNAINRNHSSFNASMINKDINIINYILKKPWKCDQKNITNCGGPNDNYNLLWLDTWKAACKKKNCKYQIKS